LTLLSYFSGLCFGSFSGSGSGIGSGEGIGCGSGSGIGSGWKDGSLSFSGKIIPPLTVKLSSNAPFRIILYLNTCFPEVLFYY
jgi:hypothetical protein